MFRNKTKSAIFFYIELLRKGKLDTMYSLMCSLRSDGSHSGDSNTLLVTFIFVDWRKLLLSYFHEVMKYISCL